MAIFPTFFLGNRVQENVFCAILERKNAFLGYKKKNFKKWKNWGFFEGVNLWVWSKVGHFSIFLFLGNTGQENVFYDILDRENAFLSYKKFKFKKSKNKPFYTIKTRCSNIGQENVFYDTIEPKKTPC